MSTITINRTRTVTETREVDLNKEQWWKITTEGDIEGRTIKQLGTHFGFLAELAQNFSGQAEYVLYFELAEHPNLVARKRSEVKISVQNVSVPALAAALRADGHDVSDRVSGVVIRFGQK